MKREREGGGGLGWGGKTNEVTSLATAPRSSTHLSVSLCVAARVGGDTLKERVETNRLSVRRLRSSSQTAGLGFGRGMRATYFHSHEGAILEIQAEAYEAVCACRTQNGTQVKTRHGSN